MSAGNNFVDLRMANAGIAGDTEDSVWPAFTDIMTVVLMIFLMSLVAFLIRNTQLVDELQTALIEKDQITETAFLSAEQNTALQAQLALVRERILSLESSLHTVTGTKDQLQKTLEQREQSVRDLETEIALLTRLRDQLSNNNSDLFKQLDVNRMALALSEQTLEETEQTLGITQQSLSKTELALAETELEYSESKNTLNEKISLLLAAKAGLIVAKEKGNQALSESEAAKLELNRRVISLSEQLRLISDKLDSQTTKNELLDSQLEDQKTILAGLSSSREELEQKLLEMAENLSHLQRLYNLRGLVVIDLREELSGGQLKFKSLQEEYESLDEEYRLLIRPARSPAGKYVVEVYLAKQKSKTIYLTPEPVRDEPRISSLNELVAQQEGKPLYSIREPDQGKPEVLSLNELHARLTALKAKHGQALYTRVRIDDKSGVGFNEAWQFTQKILSEYDYYSNDYSDTPPDSGN